MWRLSCRTKRVSIINVWKWKSPIGFLSRQLLLCYLSGWPTKTRHHSTAHSGFRDNASSLVTEHLWWKRDRNKLNQTSDFVSFFSLTSYWIPPAVVDATLSLSEGFGSEAYHCGLRLWWEEDELRTENSQSPPYSPWVSTHFLSVTSDPRVPWEEPRIIYVSEDKRQNAVWILACSGKSTKWGQHIQTNHPLGSKYSKSTANFMVKLD